MEGRPPKPIVGSLVKISEDYPNTEAAGTLALVIKTMGIECVVQPINHHSQNTHGKPWWFQRKDLQVL